MVEITGVHPYADKFPMLPESGEWFRPSVKLARFIKELTA